jgi:hypothetical protein
MEEKKPENEMKTTHFFRKNLFCFVIIFENCTRRIIMLYVCMYIKTYEHFYISMCSWGQREGGSGTAIRVSGGEGEKQNDDF